ncbi:uncharacterized protein LOC120828940 [Gasterosteus aculeatus]
MHFTSATGNYGKAHRTHRCCLPLEHVAHQRSPRLLSAEHGYGPFSLKDTVKDGPCPEEEVQHGQPDPDPGADEAYQSDGEARAILPHINLTSNETPVFTLQHLLSTLQNLLRKAGKVLLCYKSDQLTLSAEQMNEVLEVWNKVEEHEKQPQQFNQL